ncbi:hypothetical protein [Thalassotalea sp. PLHSN55]|uniref:hypothetical protein n=1 Tax=Thalassotalea sp. PLHSN55 TaxID=3435888 RepID=UPI003F8565C4
MACKYSFIVAALCISLTACNSTPTNTPSFNDTNQTPLWLDNLPTKNGVMFAVGSATVYQDELSALASAQEAGRLALAKKIRVTVAGSTSVEQSVKNNSFQASFSEAIETSVPQMELAGVQVEAEHVNTSEKTAYALLSFNKHKAVLFLRESIDTLDLELSHYHIDFNAAKDQQLKQAITIKESMLQRHQLNEQLSNFGQQKQLLSSSQRQLLADVDHMLRQITFSISGQASTLLQEKISQVLIAQGLKVVAAPADFDVQYKVTWREIEKDETFYYFADSSLALTYQDSLLGQFQQKAKGVSADKALAKDKAIEKTANQLGRELAKQLFSYFSNNKGMK